MAPARPRPRPDLRPRPGPRPPRAVRLACPAKVNLALHVGPPDANRNRRHPLTSWMVSVDLCDALTVTPITAKPGDEPRPVPPPGLTVACDAPRRFVIDWLPADDLTARAHAAYERELGRRVPVRIDLTKRIPPGGGLGGGSSDAAGVLVALQRLTGDALSGAALRNVAAGLGSDVPFALHALGAGFAGDHGPAGPGSTVVGGFGETLRPAPTAGGHLVLLLPPFGCDTAAVYAAFDAVPAYRSTGRGSARPASRAAASRSARA